MCKGQKLQQISAEELSDRIEVLSALKNELDSKIEAKLVLITPAIASEWLKKNTKNREAKNRGNLYGRIMHDGLWDFNGQPIIFSDTDLLLDGGGRLTGVVNSNCPILSMVITGVPENGFKTIDANKVRTAKDVLEASHILDGEKSAIVGYVSTMGKMILEWVAGRYGSHGAATTRPTACSLEVQEYIEAHLSQMRDCAKAAHGMTGANRESLMANGRYYAAFMGYLVIHKGWDLSDVIPFFDQLTDIHSTAREAGNPIATLRTYLFKARLGEIKITDEERFHMVSRAWNCYITDKQIKTTFAVSNKQL